MLLRRPHFFNQAESDECRLKAQQAQELMKELKAEGKRIGQRVSSHHGWSWLVWCCFDVVNACKCFFCTLITY